MDNQGARGMAHPLAQACAQVREPCAGSGNNTAVVAITTYTMTDFSDEIEPLHLGSISSLNALTMAKAKEQRDWCVILVLSKRNHEGVTMPHHLEDGCHKIMSLNDTPNTDIT
jgi:hypothetical protein